MIQRKQSIFLFLSALLGLSLLFVPVHNMILATGGGTIFLTPLLEPLVSTSTHYGAIFLNFGSLLLAFITVFLYNKRELQIKLCYLLMLFWLILTGLISFGSFVVVQEPVINFELSYIAVVIGLAGVILAFLAARYIKKDIELLKSADRIR